MSEDIDPWLEHHDPVSGRITYTRKNPPKPAPKPKPVDPKPVLTPHDQLVIHTAQVMIDRQVPDFGHIPGLILVAAR